jgi:hypothetical protein
MCAVLWATLASGGCVIEKIDAVIAEHGVTYWPSSTGDEGGVEHKHQHRHQHNAPAPPGAAVGGHGTHDGVHDDPAPTRLKEPGAAAPGLSGPSAAMAWSRAARACDDGNAVPNDGCKDCARDSIVFISSETYQGFNLGGLYGADQRCRSLAAKAGLLRPETFRAWLSTPTMSAADRMSHSRGRYTLVNGLVIANDWASLTSGACLTPRSRWTRTPSPRTRVSWTGTLADGNPR